MTGWELLALVLTGLAAGATNTIAGGGTFISYPVLLGMGLSPISANVTSAVGLISGYLGGSVSYRRELDGQASRMRRMAPSAVVGAICGAGLLLSTPDDMFATIVPYLVLLSCLLLVAQPFVKSRLESSRAENPAVREIGALVHVGVFFAAVYGTYFGAGLGVVLLAILGSLIIDDLQRLNGLRTVLSLMIKVIGVVIFLFSGEVDWAAAGVLVVAAYFGGSIGAAITRRLPGTLLRWVVILCGLTVALVLFLK